MSHQLEDLETEVCETWVGQGVCLEIADAALAAARTAIEEEGIDDFVSIESFEYIDDLPDPPLPL